MSEQSAPSPDPFRSGEPPPIAALARLSGRTCRDDNPIAGSSQGRWYWQNSAGDLYQKRTFLKNGDLKIDLRNARMLRTAVSKVGTGARAIAIVRWSGA